MAESNETPSLDKYNISAGKVKAGFQKTIDSSRKLMVESAKEGGVTVKKQNELNALLSRQNKFATDFRNIQKSITAEMEKQKRLQAELAEKTGSVATVQRSENQLRITELQKAKQSIKSEASAFARENRNVRKEASELPPIEEEPHDANKPKNKPSSAMWDGGKIGGKIGSLFGPEGTAIGAVIGGALGKATDIAIKEIKKIAAVSLPIAQTAAPLAQKGYNIAAIEKAGWRNNIGAQDILGMTGAFSNAGGGSASPEYIERMARMSKGMGINLSTMGAYTGRAGGMMSNVDRSSNASATILTNAVMQGVKKGVGISSLADIPTYMQNMESMTSSLGSSLPAISNDFISTMAGLQNSMLNKGFGINNITKGVSGYAENTSLNTDFGKMLQFYGTGVGQGTGTQLKMFKELGSKRPKDTRFKSGGDWESMIKSGDITKQWQVANEMSEDISLMPDIERQAIKNGMDPNIARIMSQNQSTAGNYAINRKMQETVLSGASGAGLQNQVTAGEFENKKFAEYAKSDEFKMMGIVLLDEQKAVLATSQAMSKLGGVAEGVSGSLEKLMNVIDLGLSPGQWSKKPAASFSQSKASYLSGGANSKHGASLSW